MAGPRYQEIAQLIDHAVLQPDAAPSDIAAGAQIAMDHTVASLCIRPSDVSQAAGLLAGTRVALSTVIAFPHGAELTEIKLAAAEAALNGGVRELDIVLNIGRLIAGDLRYVESEIGALTELIHGAGGKVKIIFENCFLDDERIIDACRVCSSAGTDWVKTSTGFGPGGATVADVSLMRKHTDPAIGVKASGGIRTLDDLLKFRELGCSRIGASATASILGEYRQRFGT